MNRVDLFTPTYIQEINDQSRPQNHDRVQTYPVQPKHWPVKDRQDSLLLEERHTSKCSHPRSRRVEWQPEHSDQIAAWGVAGM